MEANYMNLKKILILILILIIPFFVKAETCDNDNIIIESIESTEKSNGVTELDSANVKNNIINLNLKLLEIGDYTTLQEDELSEEMHNLLSKSKNRNK